MKSEKTKIAIMSASGVLALSFTCLSLAATTGAQTLANTSTKNVDNYFVNCTSAGNFTATLNNTSVAGTSGKVKISASKYAVSNATANNNCFASTGGSCSIAALTAGAAQKYFFTVSHTTAASHSYNVTYNCPGVTGSIMINQ